MPNGKLLRQLIKSGAEGDIETFKQASEAVIQEERSKQHHLLANDLEKILYGRAGTPASSLRGIADKAPVDRERGLRLIEVKQPVRSLDDVVLSSENKAAIDDVLLEHRRSETLRSFGMQPAQKLLFCGPPGCGKTLTAEVLATELGLPLAVVRVDSVVSSYLGETAASLRRVFEFAQTNALVVLFDEFDALAKERSDVAEHGELKRVVNSVLQMLDAYEGDSILIAATNHEAMLDLAIWRRFDEMLTFKLPTQNQIRELLHMKLRAVRREFDIEDSTIFKMFEGLSHAEIERVLKRAIKKMILSGQEFLRPVHLKAAFERESARQGTPLK